MAGIAGSNIGTTGVQPAIGAFVQDADSPTADTNYIGVNTAHAFDGNPLGQEVGYTVPANDDPTSGSLATWAVASGAIPFGRCDIVDGVAVASGTGAYVCHVADGVLDGQYFWATTFA
jgi:hypothetical protein